MAAEARGFHFCDTVCRGGEDFGASSDIETRFHNAIITQRNANTGVGPQQTALANRDDLFAAAGEGSHDGCPAANVRAIADDYALRNAPLHHRGAKGAGVEVHETFVHHRGSRCQVSPKSDPGSIGDPNPGRGDVVQKRREPIEA